MVCNIKSHIFKLFQNAVNKDIRNLQTVLYSFLIPDIEGDNFLYKISETTINPYLNDGDKKAILKLKPTDIIKKIDVKHHSGENYFSFTVDRNNFTTEILNLNETHLPDFFKQDETLIVEYSSPNIAKPFHFGHLRSTVVGHFVANILSISHTVIRVNYLGDWGMQFGMVQAGLENMSVDVDDLKNYPLKIINEAYIQANKNDDLIRKAKLISSNLEKDAESKELAIWKNIKDLSLKHLKETYQILGIQFDEYEWESDYAKGFNSVLDKLKTLKLVQEIDQQLVIFKDNKKIPLMKSDGTSLYLSRDILAALSRYERHKCDSIKYVIDKSQEEHVNTVRYAVSRLTDADIVDHIKFGKIIGMSTRKGTSVFLSDILEKATQLMSEQQQKSPNTKDQSLEVTQTLAVTTLIVYLLKQRRMKDFVFDWNLALQSKGDSGIKLQYTYSRLCSLEQKCGVEIPSECQPQFLTEPEVLKLLVLLGRFDKTVALSELSLESSHLINYLFKLCNLTSLCLKKLPVKEERLEVAQQRLLVFLKVKQILKSAMSILGLKPLTSM